MAIDITTIEKNECIGNSLITINGNFRTLKESIEGIEPGVTVLNDGRQIADNIGVVNFIGPGVSVASANNIANVIVPGSTTALRVVRLEEQGINTGGGQNNFFILNDGTMRACGRNQQGSLGLGTTDKSAQIPRICAFNPPFQPDEGVNKVYSQGNCSYVITTKGRVYGAGANGGFQLGWAPPAGTGTINITSIFQFINVLGESSAPLTKNNPLPGYEFALTDPVVELATGTGSSSVEITVYARTLSGRLYVWGNNKNGQAGIGGKTPNVIRTPTPILTGNVKRVTSAGSDARSTVWVVDSAGKAFVAGSNSNGQAGIGTTAGENAVLETFTSPGGLPDGYRVKKIYVGGIFNRVSTFVVLEDGSVYGCGKNNSGEISGTGGGSALVTTFQRIQGIATAPLLRNEIVEDLVIHSDTLGDSGNNLNTSRTTVWALIKDEGLEGYRLAGWGNNTSGQLGNGQSGIVASPVIAFSGWPWVQRGARVKQVAIGGNSGNKTTLVLDTDNNLWTAGSNINGRLGNGGTSSVSLFYQVPLNPSFGTPVEIRTTNNNGGHTNFLVLLSTGRVVGWGFDSAGQLGVDIPPSNISVPSLVQINQ